MLSFDEFKDYVADQIKGFLPDKFEDADVSITQINKNNQHLDALNIRNPEGNVSPVVYLNSFFEDYENGAGMGSILTEIANVYVEHLPEQSFDVSQIMNFEATQDSIVPRLIGIENNEELLENRPHVIIDDLAVVFAVDLGESDMGNASVPITNQMMESWGVSVEDLHEAAIKNMDELSPAVFKSMNEVMKEMMLPDMMRDGMSQEGAEALLESMMPPDEGKMFVLTNEAKLNGSVEILSDSVMSDVAEKLGEDFFILPSSIHETLIIPESAGMDRHELEAMVQEVNATQVAPQDRLSDHVYHYDAKDHELMRADKAEEKANARDDKKLAASADNDEKARPSLKDKLAKKKEEVGAKPKKDTPDLGKKKDMSI